MDFKVGQLVSVQRGTVNEHAQGFIGKIDKINSPEEVVIVAFDGESVTVGLDNLVQAVHYDREMPFFITEGQCAMVVAIDHPHETIGTNEEVTTSNVEKVDAKGFFRTRNTLYIPNIIARPGWGKVKSPYLR